MASVGERRAEKRVDDVQGELRRQRAAAQCHDVGVVVLEALLRVVGMMHQRGAPGTLFAAIADGRLPASMADDEAVLYDFCTELYHTQGVSDATYSRMVSEFEEIGVIDTIGIMGYYSMLAMVLNTARTPLREGQTPGLKPFPR